MKIKKDFGETKQRLWKFTTFIEKSIFCLFPFPFPLPHKNGVASMLSRHSELWGSIKKWPYTENEEENVNMKMRVSFKA